MRPLTAYVPGAQARRRVTGASSVEGGWGRPAARVRLAVTVPSSRETMRALPGSGGEAVGAASGEADAVTLLGGQHAV